MNKHNCIEKLYLANILLLIINVQVNHGQITVEELRKKLLSEDQAQFDKRDVQRVESDKEFVNRYIEETDGDGQKALELMISSLKWRKSFGINQLNATSFPQEFYRWGLIFTLGLDTNGHRVVILRVSVFKKFSPKVQDLVRKLFAYQIELASKSGACVVVDVNDVSTADGIAGLDLDLIYFLASNLVPNYPSLIKKALINDLPPGLSFVVETIRRWLPEKTKKILHVIKRDQLEEHIAKDQLPDFLQGTNKTPYRTPPTGAPTLRDLSKSLGIDDGETERIIKHIDQLTKN